MEAWRLLQEQAEHRELWKAALPSEVQREVCDGGDDGEARPGHGDGGAQVVLNHFEAG